MILYLEFSGRGRRGGERYHQKLHAFIRKRFPSLEPSTLSILPDNVRSPQDQVRHCLELARAKKPQLVISDISSAARNMVAVRQVLRAGGQLMLVVQAEPSPAAGKSWWRRLLVARCQTYLFRNAALAVTNSAFTAALTRRLAHSALPVVVAPPGLETAPLPALPPRGDGPLQLNLLYVGEISRVKGLMRLVEALGHLPSLDYHLNIVGGHSQEPDYFGAVTAAISRLGINDRLTFHGYADRERLNQFYRQADILLVPSQCEGYGMVIAEGFCHGLPVIASATGAIPEIVAGGVNGLLVPPRDAGALASALSTLAHDSGLRQRMSIANLEKAQSLPTWDDFERKLDEQLIPQIESLLGQALPRL